MSKAFSATKSKTEIVELFNQIEQRKGSLLLAVSEVDMCVDVGCGSLYLNLIVSDLKGMLPKQ